jgi:PAS domain S-box-containing protein
MSDGLRKVSADGIIRWANRGELELVGYVAGEYIGQPMARFFEDECQAGELLQRLRRGEAFKDIYARLRAKDGSTKHVLVNGHGCFDEDEPSSMRFFTRDITRQWLAEQALRKGIAQQQVENATN